MIRKLSGLVGSPVLKGALAIVCSTLAVKLLTDAVVQLRSDVDDLSAAATERALYLAQLQGEIKEAERVHAMHVKRPYPSREDLAPLVEPAGEGEAVELELQRP